MCIYFNILKVSLKIPRKRGKNKFAFLLLHFVYSNIIRFSENFGEINPCNILADWHSQLCLLFALYFECSPVTDGLVFPIMCGISLRFALQSILAYCFYIAQGSSVHYELLRMPIMRKPNKKELKLQLFLKGKTICCVSMPVCLHVRM